MATLVNGDIYMKNTKQEQIKQTEEEVSKIANLKIYKKDVFEKM